MPHDTNTPPSFPATQDAEQEGAAADQPPHEPGSPPAEQDEQNQPRVLLTVEAAAERLSIGRTSMFALLKTGEVNSVMVGRLRRIPATELDAYVQCLAAKQARTDTIT